MQSNHLLLFIFALLLGLTGCSRTATLEQDQPGTQSGFDPADLNPAIRPQDDFYAYVNARWIESTEIPPEWSRYGTMQIVYERTEQQLKAIVQEAATQSMQADENTRKIGDLYTSFMDTDRIEALAFTPLADLLTRIDALENHDDIIRFFGQALAYGITVPVNFYIDADAGNPEQALVYFWQDGLGLPDRDYYFSDSPELTEIREKYRVHIDNLLALAGWSESMDARSIIAIEQQLAENHWSRVQNRDREKIYRNKFSLADTKTLSPNFDWPGFLTAGGFGAPETFIIAQTDYFAALSEIIPAISVSDWQDYLRLNTLRAFAPYLNAAIVSENFDFRRRVLRGQERIRPRWKRGVRLADQSLGEVVGAVYIERHFPPEARQRINVMIENLRAAFSDSINTLEWMSDDTKLAALRKLEMFNAKIGYPDQWKDYSSLRIDSTDLIGNVRRVREFEHQEAVAKLAKPIDRDEWGMTPQTVNAYYRATLNEIVFPAAILQPPFFDVTADDAFNYGAIGAVIGHEFSHGFDDQGRKFDGEGRLADWWSEQDALDYETRSAGLVEQYANFKPLPDQAINGELTLGENIADLAGLTMAYRAWRILVGDQKTPKIDGFTGDERFFIGYAAIWRTKVRDEYLREMLVNGPHSPPRYRVTGALRNMEAFHQAFNTAAGDGMYLPIEDRVRIW